MKTKYIKLKIITIVIIMIALQGCGGSTDFEASITNITTGTSINFTDLSTNSPVSWNWTFSGTTPATFNNVTPSNSAAQHPTNINYNTPGTYDVTLTITKSDGTTHSITKSDYIIVTAGSPNTFPGQTVTVTGGTYDMGSPNGTGFYFNEYPLHSVSISTFEISKYEITNQQYVAFLNNINADSDGSVGGVEYVNIINSPPIIPQISHNGSSFEVVAGKENYPVTMISWFGAKAFSEYYGGRLPTEAEWEFAAKGGNSSNSYTYSGSNILNDVAWADGNISLTNSRISNQVGLKVPNELGLFDMTGNVAEWINDWYGEDYYSNSTNIDPQGPLTGTVFPRGAGRVIRGGHWNSIPLESRVVRRSADLDNITSINVGFRPVFTP